MKFAYIKLISAVIAFTIIIVLAKPGVCEFSKGHYTNPEVDVSWQVNVTDSSRLQLTGQLRNVSMHDQFDVELRVRILSEKGDMLGNAIFKFNPSRVNPDAMLPFGMMVDVPDLDHVSRADFDLHYEVVTLDKMLLPQFIQFSDILNRQKLQ